MIITNSQEFNRLLTALNNTDIAVIDVESNGLNLHGSDTVVGIAIYIPNDISYYYPIAHGYGNLTDLALEDVKDMKWNKRDKKLVTTQETYRVSEQANAQRFNRSLYELQTLIDAYATVDTVIMHNAPFDLTGLYYLGFPTPKRVLDTMISAYCLFSQWHAAQFLMPDTGVYNRGNRALKWQARLFNVPGATDGESDLQANIASLSDRLKAIDKHCISLDSKKHLWMLPPDKVNIYAELDVKLTYGLYQKHLALMHEYDVTDVFNTLCDVQLQALWRMHLTGFAIDSDKAIAMLQGGANRAQEIEIEAKAIVGDSSFNIASSKQVVEYLRGLALDINSADKEVIATHKETVPLLRLVEEYRDITKKTGVYANKWLEASHLSRDGVIHPSFNIGGTSTGRLSSSDDYVGNFQNIPREAAGSLSPKNLLLPVNPEYCLVEVDYSTLEMRIGAWVAERVIANDSITTLTDLIINDIDMHAYTRDKAHVVEILLGGRVINEANVIAYLEARNNDIDSLIAKHGDIVSYFINDYARHKAKTMNFASMYGGGGKALSMLLGIGYEQAKELAANWRKAYPSIVNAMNVLSRKALERRPLPNNSEKFARYIRYPLNDFPFMRRYDLYDAKARNKLGGIWSPMENEARNAFNSVVQGTAGGICIVSAMRIAKTYSIAVDLHATVHDSVILSLHKINLPLLKDVAAIMCDYDVYPPLKVDFKIAQPGESWGSMKTLDIDAL